RYYTQLHRSSSPRPGTALVAVATGHPKRILPHLSPPTPEVTTREYPSKHQHSHPDLNLPSPVEFKSGVLRSKGRIASGLLHAKAGILRAGAHILAQKAAVLDV
ncbi:Uncharacterized protein FKW44_019076, partial [Caligus rogercresseyi]